MIQVTQIINDLFTSNSFVVETTDKECIIIDPGQSYAKIIDFLSKNDLCPKSVVLTHEHYDHIAGVEALLQLFDFDLICSKACETGIKDSRQNFSYYMDEIKPFSINSKAIVIEEDSCKEIAGFDCLFLLTPGHSPGGICIKIGNAVFTGDTLLNNTRTPLNLFHSNKSDYTKSLQKLKTALQPGNIIYPGHGQSFIFTSALIEI